MKIRDTKWFIFWCLGNIIGWWWIVSINVVLWISSLGLKQSDKAIMTRGTYHCSSKASKGHWCMEWEREKWSNQKGIIVNECLGGLTLLTPLVSFNFYEKSKYIITMLIKSRKQVLVLVRIIIWDRCTFVGADRSVIALMDWLGSMILDLWVLEGAASEFWLVNESDTMFYDKLCYLIGCINNIYNNKHKNNQPDPFVFWMLELGE